MHGCYWWNGMGLEIETVCKVVGGGYDTNAWACICHNLAYSPSAFSNSS